MMAAKVKWDKFEAALLLDAYLKIENGEIKRSDAVAGLSVALRNRAVYGGAMLDEKFRNPNGISYQLGAMQYVVTNGESGVPHAPMLFQKTYKLYHQNPAEFTEVLNAAISQTQNKGVELEEKIEIGLETKTPKSKEVAKNAKIEQCLHCHFRHGFTAGSMIDLMRLRKFYEEDNGEECSMDDDSIVKAINSLCFEFSGKLFALTSFQKKIVEDKLNMAFLNGSTIVYFQEFYDHESCLLYENGIISWEMLREFVVCNDIGGTVRKKYVLARGARGTELACIVTEINRIWQNPTGMSIEDVANLLPNIPREKIRIALSSASCFVWSSKETYVRVQDFIILDSEIEEISEHLASLVLEHGRASFDDLPIGSVRQSNSHLSDVALFDLILTQMPSTYYRSGKTISTTRVTVGANCSEVVVNYCSSRDECTFSELNQIVEKEIGEKNYPATVDAANSVMVRVSEDRFCAPSLVHFDTERVDQCIRSAMKGQCLGMKEVVAFATFPDCGFAWNLYLLESFCRRESREYRYLAHTHNSANCGAIVRQSFAGGLHEAMAYRVAESGVPFNEKEIFDFLLEKGFLVRRRYSKMRELIDCAKLIRAEEI